MARSLQGKNRETGELIQKDEKAWGLGRQLRNEGAHGGRSSRTTKTRVVEGEDPEEWFWEAHGIQLELFPPEPPKKQEVGTDAPHHNILERYYGKDWKPKAVEGLEDHY